MLRPRLIAPALVLALSTSALAATRPAAAPPPADPRAAAPLVLTGAQVPGWSAPAVQGVAQPWPSGVTQEYADQVDTSFGVRTAHNGTLAPAVRPGVPVDEVAAYAWSGHGWREVPVQVDERFPYFLANARSGFAFYSGTDQELTYAWGPTRHAVGEEAWKKVFGSCEARYATSTAEVQAAVSARTIALGPQETLSDYLHAMPDPVAGLDDDDEIALQSRDAGVQAPSGAAPPAGAADGQTVRVADPLDPQGTRYLYLFRKAGGSSFRAADGPVQMVRAADADRWLDRGSFAAGSPEALGVSNTGYGPNVPGTVCDPAGPVRVSGDRFPRDAMTVSTPTYRVTATGRWMVRGVQVRDGRTRDVGCRGSARHQVCRPDDTTYGPDLVDRWKGRAFQQSPDSSVSLVGFEDEQVNWEANSALLGWRQGPVRAIREVWGADSGTNVTKTETYYRDADVYRYHLRVHPIPPDGLYTSWDYNKGVATRYYNLLHPEGVAIDGVNDDTGQVNQLPDGTPAYFDVPDPTFDAPSAVDRPEQVAGEGSTGGLVYVFELNSASSATNALVVPYYRDDACMDDGTGDDPVARPWPGEASTDTRVKDGYAAANGTAYAKLVCDPAHGKTPFQGAYGSHGIHFFATQDSDNATLGAAVTEVDGQQWRFSVPMTAPRNVLQAYAPNVVVPLRAVVTPYALG